MATPLAARVVAAPGPHLPASSGAAPRSRTCSTRCCSSPRIGLGRRRARQAGQRRRSDGIAYLAFVTPGLMAAARCRARRRESLWPIMAGTKWIRVFHAMVATPIRPERRVPRRRGVDRRARGDRRHGLPRRRRDARWRALVVGAARDPRRRAHRAARSRRRSRAWAATQDTDFRFPVIMRLGIIPLFLVLGDVLPDLPAPRLARSRCAGSRRSGTASQLCRGATTGSIDGPEAVANVARARRVRRAPARSGASAPSRRRAPRHDRAASSTSSSATSSRTGASGSSSSPASPSRCSSSRRSASASARSSER